MARKPLIGTCHICGANGKLSFEHVPPKRAFNNKQVIRVGFNEAITVGPYDRLKEPIEQGALELTPSARSATTTQVAGARTLSRTGASRALKS